jgi:hypothetical protein
MDSDTNLPTNFAPARFGNINSFTNLIIPILLTGAGIMLLIMLFRGAFLIITAGGNPEQVQQAQSMFKYAAFGFIIIVLSFVFVKILGLILGVEVFI